MMERMMIIYLRTLINEKTESLKKRQHNSNLLLSFLQKHLEEYETEQD